VTANDKKALLFGLLTGELVMKKTRKSQHLDPAFVCGYKDPMAIRELLTKVGDSWSIYVVLTLAKLKGNRARFSELERAIPGISQRMLSMTLRSLERDGLVMREIFPEVPPRVEYELTPLGKTLLVPLQGLVDWVTGNWELVRKSQGQFDVKGKSKTVS
jgi:DNA-binding HxlR family transcriptional regulator